MDNFHRSLSLSLAQPKEPSTIPGKWKGQRGAAPQSPKSKAKVCVCGGKALRCSNISPNPQNSEPSEGLPGCHLATPPPGPFHRHQETGQKELRDNPLRIKTLHKEKKIKPFSQSACEGQHFCTHHIKRFNTLQSFTLISLHFLSIIIH